MSDARWFEIDADVRAAVSHFERAGALHEQGGFEHEGLAGYQAQMALMHSLQSGHTSLEAALLRVLEMLREERPAGDNWHADLIRRVSSEMPDRRPRILSGSLERTADETRRFRHLAVHAYDTFRVDATSPAIAAARRLAEGLQRDILAFRLTIDPPEAFDRRER